MDLLPLALGALVAAAMAPGALRAFAQEGWTRVNFRGAALPFPAGAIAICAAIVALGLLAVAERAFEEPLVEPALAWLPLWLGVAFLGLLDDLLDAAPRGWRGHARAVLGGGFSTGAMKAGGTAALAFAVLVAAGLPLGEAVLSTAVIALATNLFNLLDLRPGRAAKAWVLLAGGLLLAEADTGPLRIVGALAGPLLVLGVLDLRERCMLGDTGANVLGAVAGTWLVLSLGVAGEAVAAAILLALTAYGEFRSFTAAIERVAPLRRLDGLARRR